MTALLKIIKADRITAMKNGDKAKRETLQLLLAKIEKVQIENKAELSKEQIESVIQKSIKELDKEIESYVAVGRGVEKQDKEKELLLSYLPKQMTSEELATYVGKIGEEIKQSGLKIGEAIKTIGEKVKGKADMKQVSQLVKEIYNNKK